MGQYGEIYVQFSSNEEQDDKVYDILENFPKEVDEHIAKGSEFHAEIAEIVDTGSSGFFELYIKSDRIQNARWQTNCLIKLLQIHNIEVINLQAEETTPVTIIDLDDDFNEYEPNITF
jgi:hypothetical protein